MRLVILTGDQPRHFYFVHTLSGALAGLRAVFVEGKAFNPAGDVRLQEEKLAAATQEERELWEWHFGLARQEEEKFFGEHRILRLSPEMVRRVPKGEINNPEWVEAIRREAPDAIAVFGTSLLKPPLIALAPGRIINMHLGLSPYYRGSGTNFWSLHNGEPEYVGATIHLIDAGIDTGAIVHQARPGIESGDNQHSIGNRAIIAGTRLMIQALRELGVGTMRCVSQTAKGRLYRRRDFSVKSIRRLKDLMESGLIEQYLLRRDEAIRRAPIVP